MVRNREGDSSLRCACQRLSAAFVLASLRVWHWLQRLELAELHGELLLCLPLLPLPPAADPAPSLAPPCIRCPMQLCSPPGSSLTMATAPWTMGAAASGLRLQQQQQHSDSGGGTSLAMAVQQHLLLASTAKAGPGPAAAASALPSYRESGLAARQLTLTGGKPPAPAAVAVAASPARQQLTSSSVRMRLHALLDSA